MELTERALHDAIAELSTREQEILNLRYGLTGTDEPKSLEEIGRILGITRERVRQLEKEALRRLAERREIAAMRACLGGQVQLIHEREERLRVRGVVDAGA